MKDYMRLKIPFWLLLFLPFLSQGQEEQVTLKGNFRLGANFSYSNNDSLGIQRPKAHFLLGFTPKLQYKDWKLSSLIYLQARTGDFSAYGKDFFTGYRNNLGIRVQYKQLLDLRLGRISPKTSGAVSGNVPLTGVKFSYSPRKLRTTFFAGIGRRAIEENTRSGQFPRYGRRFLGAEIRQGKENASHIDLSIIYAADQANSILLPEKVRPKSSLAGGLKGAVQLEKGYFFNLKAAASVFVNNQLAQGGDKGVFSNSSSRFGYLGGAGIGKKGKIVSLEISADYVSPTYKSLAVFYQESDYLDTKLKGSLKLLKNHLLIAGETGIRLRQLTQNRQTGGENLQLISRLNAQYQPSTSFSIAAHYSNFDIRLIDNTARYYYDPTELITDTIRGYYLKWSSNNFGISPQFNVGKQGKHRIWASYTGNTYRNYELENPSFSNENTLNNIAAGYSTKVKNTRIGLDVAYLKGNGFSDLASYSVKPWLRLQFFDKKLSLNSSIRLAYNRINRSTDRQVYGQLGLRYKLSKKLQLKANLFINNYQYGVLRNNAQVQIFRFNTSFSYTL